MSFLIKTLELNNMTLNDVVLVPVLDGIVSAQQFKSGSVDAAVVWTPDDLDCLDSQKGSKVLVSTKSATNIIPDGLVSTDRYITEHPEVLTKLLQAWLETNAELNTNPAARQEAAQAFVKMFEGIDISFAENGLRNVYLTTYGDNLNFFGMNNNYTGVTGEELYTKMSLVYSNLKSLTGVPLTISPLPWRTVANTSIIKNVKMNASGINAPEAVATYTEASNEIKTKEALSNKKVSINFETNSYTLDDTDKSIIDREFIPIAKSFATRIRVEGNTDAIGDPQLNKKLSYNRAKAVVNYMVNDCGFDPKRFIIVGNGSDKAIAAGVYSASEEYRVTEFQLISEE
jgi:NitT/TauT family transport system substrate-binding protein